MLDSIDGEFVHTPLVSALRDHDETRQTSDHEPARSVADRAPDFHRHAAAGDPGGPRRVGRDRLRAGPITRDSGSARQRPAPKIRTLRRPPAAAAEPIESGYRPAAETRFQASPTTSHPRRREHPP